MRISNILPTRVNMRLIWLLAAGWLLLSTSLQAAELGVPSRSATNAPSLSGTNTSSAGTNAASFSGTNTLSSSRRLQPNDTLQVSVYQQPDLTTAVTIDDRGKVMLPLLGSIKLGGLTLEQATGLVQELYDRDYLVDPKVTIQIGQFAVLRFTILGQVQRPGTYEFPPNENLNLLEGIAKAGGYTRLAAPSKVTLQRSVDGKLKVFTLDAEQMAKDRQHNPFMLIPGDTITVGERVF